MKKIMLIVLEEGQPVPRGSWDFAAADMIIQKTEVSDTYKVIKSKWDKPGGFVRRISE